MSLRPARGRVGLLVTVVAAVAVLAAAGFATARSAAHGAKRTPVPPGFVGINLNSPMLDPGGHLNTFNQMNAMVADGVESVRAAFNWAAMQPYATQADVPASQQQQFSAVPEPVPTDFSATDQLVGDAARHGISVLPTILYTPAWDAQNNGQALATPARVQPYADFAAELVMRYGPRGSFWTAHPGVPKRPIRMWQVWNEPNLPYYWPQPFAASYVQLLRAAHAAIKQADPGSKVVLGALTNLAWNALGQIYGTGGDIRSQFEIVSVNGFTRTPSNVLLYLRLVRRSLRHYKDGGKPLLATELSWPSAAGQTLQNYDFNVSAALQARNVGAVLPMLGADRTRLHLIGFYYYTWIGEQYHDAPAFNFAGLLSLRRGDGRIVVKPALAAFRRGVLRLEQCRAKGAVATDCLH